MQAGDRARYQESTDTVATDLAAGPAISLVFELCRDPVKMSSPNRLVVIWRA